MFQDTVKESFFHLIFTEDFLLANCYSRRKSFLNNCTTKETISKVKRQPSEWEKIIANEAIDEQLISKIDTRARTRSPSPRAWRPDFPGAAREAP